MDRASDFYTGVTAALITRSGSPAWVPATLKDVSEPACLPGDGQAWCGSGGQRWRW